MKKIEVTDEEMKNKARGIATLARIVDEKAGFTTKLLSREYRPLENVTIFTVEKYF